MMELNTAAPLYFQMGFSGERERETDRERDSERERETRKEKAVIIIKLHKSKYFC